MNPSKNGWFPKDNNSDKGLRSSKVDHLDPLPEDIKIAQTLLRKATIKGFIPSPRKSSVSSWSKHIAAIHLLDGYDPKVVIKVAKFYLSHIGEKYIPEAYSGKSFRERFPKICRAMTRITGKDPAPKTIEISKEAYEIKEEVEEYLPENHPNDLLPLIQRSLDEATDFLNRIEIVKSSKLEFPMNEYVERIDKYIPRSPKLLVEEWFNGIIDKLFSWNEWDGRLPIFSIDSKWMRKMESIDDLITDEGYDQWVAFHNLLTKIDEQDQ